MSPEDGKLLETVEILAVRDLGFAYLEEGVWDQAEVLFRGLISIDERDAFAQLGLAHSLRGQGRVAEAIQAARLALGAQPDYLDAALFLVESYLQQGLKQEAETVLSVANHLAGMGNGGASSRLLARLASSITR